MEKKKGTDLIGAWIKIKRTGENAWIREYFDGWYFVETEESRVDLLHRADFFILKEGE